MAEGLIQIDKRHLFRKELIYYLRILDELNGKELGRMVDIHVSGLLLMATKPLNIAQEHLMRIEMPKALKEQGVADVVVKAKTVWVKPSLTPPYLENGIMFLEPSIEAKATIEQLIEMFALPGGTVTF